MSNQSPNIPNIMLTESLEGLQFRLSQRNTTTEIADNIYTVASVVNGIATVTWENGGVLDEVTYTEQELIQNINNNDWILV